MPDDYLRVSYSSLNLFSNCARKFEFSKLYPRRARDYDTFAADVGTCLHHGYQNYLMTRCSDKAMWAMMESYPYAAEWNQDNDFRSLEACAVTLDEMIDSAAMQDFQIAQIKRPLTGAELAKNLDTPEGFEYPYDPSGIVVPAVEVPFELYMDGIVLPDGRGIAITGFVDAFLINQVTHGFRTLDIKTHRSTIEDATSKYKFNTQQVPYGIVLEHIQGRRIDEFEVLYLDTYVDLAEPKVKLYGFDKDQDSLQEWLMNTALKCQQIKQFMEMDYFPRTDGGCMSFNKPCFYLQICEIRERKYIENWLLSGDEPEHKEPEIPWVTAHIDVYGEQVDG